MKKIDISIIIPCYNCAATIVETLQSVECSTYHNYEVIVVNDGSVDSSEMVIDGYKSNSQLDIRVIKQENSGVSVARNRGIEESRGEYLLFLDGDDLFAEGYIEAVSVLMERYHADVMACYRTTDRNELTKIEDIEGHHSVVDAMALLEQYTYSKTKFGFTSFVYRKSILDKYGIRFVPNVKYGEDWEFATKYLAHCKTAVELHYYYYYYRILETSVSRTTSYRQIDAIHAAERTADYLEQNAHPFAKRFRQYMYNRSIFSVAHRFAKGDRKDFFDQLIEQYPVKRAMAKIKNDPASDYKAKLAAMAYMVSPKLFYLIAKNK